MISADRRSDALPARGHQFVAAPRMDEAGLRLAGKELRAGVRARVLLKRELGAACPGADICMEYRWRHVEHLPGVHVPLPPACRKDGILWEDLLRTAEGEEVAVNAVCAAFPDHGMDAQVRRRAVSPSCSTLALPCRRQQPRIF